MFVEPDALGSNAGTPTSGGDEPPRTSFGRARSVSAGSDQMRFDPIDSRYAFRRVNAPLRQPGKSGSGSSICFLFRELVSVSSMGGIVDGWKEKAAYGGTAALQTLEAVGRVNIGVATASAIVAALTVSLFFDALPPLEASIEEQRAATARTFQDRSGRLAYLVLIATSSALALGGMVSSVRGRMRARDPPVVPPPPRSHARTHLPLRLRSHSSSRDGILPQRRPADRAPRRNCWRVAPSRSRCRSASFRSQSPASASPA